MTTSNAHNTNSTTKRRSKSVHWLDELLEATYRELFGEDYLYEDMLLLRTEKINRLDVPEIPVNIQYERAMAEYRRELENEVTQYQMESTISFPPTMQYIKVPDPEEGLELNIDPREITEIMGIPDAAVKAEEATSKLSNRKRKKEEWRTRRNMDRRMKTCKKED